MARLTTSYNSIFGGLVIWGLAPKRVAALSEQCCGRSAVALNWYVRVWDLIDAGISALGDARARELWRLLYRERRPKAVAGRAMGYTKGTVRQNNERDIARLKAHVNMAELERLLQWRVTFRKMVGGTFTDEIRGFELDEGARRMVERDGQTLYSVIVDWREVARVMDDPAHVLDEAALRTGWARDG